MLFFSYNDEPVKRQSIFEVDINGQPANQDDDDAPTDYTAGDDAGAEDTGAPADDATAPNPNPAAPQAAQQDDTNPTDNPEYYTLPDTEDQGDEPPGGGMDTRMNTPAPAAAPATGEGGGDAAPTDYTAGGDTGGDRQVQADDARGLENELFKDLTKDQIDIKHRELKSNFTDLYNSTSNIIDRVNAIPNNDNYMQAITFVSKQLSSLRQMIADYMTNVYSTKSYMENTVNYNRFLATLKGINDILDEINKDINS